AYDELVSQTDARNNTYTMTYDLLGRITERAGDETTTWAYSATPGHLGELTSVSCDNNTSQAYFYDNLGRMTSQTENIQGETFTQYYTYDGLGRLQTQSWNTGFGIKHLYNQYGYLDEVQNASEETIWEAETYNVRGQIMSYKLGDDYRTTRDWDSYGFPEEVRTKVIGQTPDIICHIYLFDELKGNLTQRRSTANCYNVEDFTYDALNRLTDETISSNTRSTDFALNGNITNRSDVGDYNYSGIDAGPHAATGLINTTGNLLPTNDQTVDYTSFNKASHISQGNLDYFITYGPDRLRRYTNLRNDITEDALLTKYYAFGDYEKVTDADGTKHSHYISGGDGLAAIYVKYDYAPDSMYFIMKDHLGSMVGAINEETGTVFRQSFDAWGRNRNPENWTYTNIPDFIFDRGYTGHEHLKWFGLINMNGRMYDAGLCRFLSPDPYVQMPDYSQNFNRYSYCLNNPLIYSDPSGEFLFLIPHIGYSNGGGLDIGLTFGVGVPGLLSAQITAGHSFGSNNSYTSLGGTAFGINASIGYGTQSGLTAGANFGFGPPGLNTGATSFGIGYSENGGLAVNGLGFSYNGNVGFDPGIGYSHSFNFARIHEPAFYASIDDPPTIYGGMLAETEIISPRITNGPSRYNYWNYFSTSAEIITTSVNQVLDYSFLFPVDMYLAAYDFYSNYFDMREADWIKSDKYFHAKANFQAAHRGPGGEFFAEHFSNLREIYDQRIKGYPLSDSKLDQRANNFGRDQSRFYSPIEFREALNIYRPTNLPIKY
nr:hypothetical protein [Bacteroidota bacterium]